MRGFGSSSNTAREWVLPVATQRLIFTAGIIGGAVLGFALAAAAIITSEGALGAAAGLCLGGTAAAWWQTRQSIVNAGLLLVIWATMQGLAIPLAPPSLVASIFIGLTITVIMGILILRPPQARRFLVFSTLIWASQFAWNIASGRSVEAIDAGVWAIEITALLVGAQVTFLVKQELTNAALEYRALFDSVPIGLYQSSSDGSLRMANRHLTEMLGSVSIDALTDRAGETRNPSSAADNPKLMTSTDPDHAVERQLVCPDGRIIWVQERGRAINDEQGRLLRHEGVLEDITAHKLAAEATRQASERFRRAFEDAPIGMALVSHDGHFESVNQAFCLMLGFDEEELLTMGWRDITPGEDEAINAAAVAKLRSEGLGSIEMERHYTRADGQLMVGKIALSVITEGGPESGHIIAQVVDITAEKHLQERLEDLMAAKDEFIASVSHELRTPLTVVLGLAMALRDDIVDTSAEEQEEIIADIADHSTALAHIVDDLLVVAKADIGKLDINPEIIDLYEHIQTAVAECSYRSADQDLVIPHGQASVCVDPLRFRQIMRNLITNAYRYGGDLVLVEAAAADNEAVVRVIDNGNGIPVAERDAIFDPYYRAHDARGVTGSIGLGLAVSQKLAQAMAGNISYHREHGRSVFELSLPDQSGGGTEQTATLIGASSTS